jgi:hypothetical protein
MNSQKNRPLKIEGYEKGKPIRNLIYGLTHPLQMAEKKPLMFLLVVGGGVMGVGIWQGWWTWESIKALLPFNKG